MTDPLFLTLEEILQIHAAQIAEFGGIETVRDMDLLRSAIAQPSLGHSSGYVHPDLPSMAAAYLFHIVQNHPFGDGNKRTGAAAAILFLEMNDVEDPFSDERIVDLTLAVAEGRLDKAGLISAFRGELGYPQE